MRSQPRTQVGTLHYAAPEVFQPDAEGYDLQADMWSLGVTLYIMLVGAYPFLREEDKRLPAGIMNGKMIKRILKADYFIPSYVKCSLEVKDLLKHLLVVDRSKRYTIQEVKRHPWFLTNLPSGAINMNLPEERKRYELKFKCHQSEDEIREILGRARQASDGTVHDATHETDPYDEMVDDLVPKLNSTQLDHETDDVQHDDQLVSMQEMEIKEEKTDN
eukprot:TRINITY_DN24967_c0_g1_i2.p2 TRINITY_DN24967_c0_g1~~TRINITY_DN24967_c0_g1_i2.p2  ORF type:complete len:218 (+),score=27.84 TRINITY_DN24967_c0_g1_i2:577-1230(+)